MSNLVDGRYQLIDVIGAGGMATVWRAQDLRLNRMVALKRPRPVPAGPASGTATTDANPLDPSMLQARMSREMQLAASLSHPNLVTVHDAGHDEEGLYLVMELVEAPSLAEVLVHAGRLDRTKGLTIGAEIADALAAVHKVGIVHRDVKPGNILLAEAGAKLTDFGIATGTSSDATSQTALTMAGSVLATYNYASPEVLAGDTPTDRSDVYSLASVVYQMQTGRLPFADTSRMGPPPSCGEAALDNVFAEALAHDAWRRPDAATFASRLRAVVTPAGPAAGFAPAAPPVDSTSPIQVPPAHLSPAPVVDPTAAMPSPPVQPSAMPTATPGATVAMPPHLRHDQQHGVRPSAPAQPAPKVVGRPLLPDREPAAPQPPGPVGGSRRRGGGGRRPDGPGSSSNGAGGRLAAMAAVAAAVVLLAGFLIVQAVRSDDSVETTGETADQGDGNRIDAGEGEDITPQTLPSTTTTSVPVEDDGEVEEDADGDQDPLSRTLDDLEDALDRADEEFDDTGLPSAEVEDLLDRARDAIDSARESDELENVRRLDELRRQIDDVVGDDSEDSARGRLERLARLLGLGGDDSDSGSDGDSGENSGGGESGGG